jgi:hypothetical protein
MNMRSPNPYQSFEALSGNTYQSNQYGIISNVASGDVVSLLNMGCTPSTLKTRLLAAGAVLTASLTGIISNVALTNLTLTIAAQPDVPRQLVLTMAPGAAAVTAGQALITYVAADGSVQVETASLITGSGVTVTYKTVKAVAELTSVVTSGVVGGSSPTIEMGTNGVIGLPAEQGAIGFSVFKETYTTVSANITTGVITPVITDQGTLGAVDAINGLYTPTTAPNTAKQINVWFNYN